MILAVSTPAFLSLLNLAVPAAHVLSLSDNTSMFQRHPAAIKEYEEGLKRNPDAIAIFSNRCAAYIKLMEPTTALKDADKCLELDPKFVKAYARKGTCHHLMKEYHKAMKAFEDGLKIDPTSKDCTDGKNRTL